MCVFCGSNMECFQACKRVETGNMTRHITDRCKAIHGDSHYAVRMLGFKKRRKKPAAADAESMQQTYVRPRMQPGGKVQLVSGSTPTDAGSLLARWAADTGIPPKSLDHPLFRWALILLNPLHEINGRRSVLDGPGSNEVDTEGESESA